MVLAELGQQIAAALQKIQSAPVVDEQTLNECLKEIATALLEGDVNVKYVAQIRNNIKAAINSSTDTSNLSKKRLIQKLVVTELVKILTPSKEPFKLSKGKRNVVMFVGLQGSGKTTTCTKYAHHYRRKGWRVGLVCADTFRAGAFDQLKQNATKIGIPFYGSYTEADPVRIGREGVERFKAEKFDLIVVDTSGRHRQESALFEEMRQMAQAVTPDDIVFIMDSHIGQACFDQAKAFRDAVDVGSVIVTKLDGHAKGGGALSAVAATDSPIIFLGTGEHFDDFETFNAESFISRLLGFGDMKGLISTVTEAMPLDQQPEMLDRLAHGIFTFQDMRDQFQNLLNMGPISQVMSMIPGMGSNLIPKGKEKEGVAQIKRFLVMMDSMRKDELNCKRPLTEARIVKIARGSGHMVAEVKMMIDRYKQLSKLVGRLGKMGLGKKGAGGLDMQQLRRNPNQVLQNMQRAIDPKMLKQMGGVGNMMQLMKQFGSMESMPEMQQMMQGLGAGGAGGGRGARGRGRRRG